MQHPDEGVIHTWLDGELPAEEAAALEAHIAGCSDCAAAVAEARGLIAASSRIVSALDIVPGDVIPAAAPRKRAWYANTQLRAAAAVLFVAGASLVLIRRERVPEMERIMDRAASTSAASAPAASTLSAVEADSARPPVTTEGGTARRDTRESVMNAPAEQPAQNEAVPKSRMAVPLKSGTARRTETQPMQKVAASEPSTVVVGPIGASADAARPTNQIEEKALGGKIAGGRVSAPPPAPVAAVAPPADLQQRNLSRLRDSSLRLDAVVVTGVATSSAKANDASREAKLRELKSDTAGNVVVTIYELSPGIQVTLSEAAPQAFAPKRVEADQLKKEKSAASSVNAARPAMAPPPVAGLRTDAKIEVITWTNSSTGRVYTLSGPLSKEQLTALRKGLPADKR